MNKLIFGVDPGAGGAVATLLVEDGVFRLIDTFDMPTAKVKVGKKHRSRILEAAISDNIRNLMVKYGPDNPFVTVDEVFAVIEEVHAMPKQGVSSTFQFGVAFGTCLGVFAGLGIKTKLVTPQTWQKTFRVPKGKEGARVTAARLFPLEAKTFARSKDHGRADAALIALYGTTIK